MNARTHTKLEEFVKAQAPVYGQVRRELAAGRKQTHWIWFIFPQMEGLGFSSMSKKFGIASADEASNYLEHEVLGPRLRECVQLILALPNADISSILGPPDDMKFFSSMTLFAAVAPGKSIFTEALEKYFDGGKDEKTLALLQQSGNDISDQG